MRSSRSRSSTPRSAEEHHAEEQHVGEQHVEEHYVEEQHVVEQHVVECSTSRGSRGWTILRWGTTVEVEPMVTSIGAKRALPRTGAVAIETVWASKRVCDAR